VNLLKKLYLYKERIMLINGFVNGDITFFDDDLYKKMSTTYISCIPVSIHIKYLKPKWDFSEGRCYDRSLYMFLSLEESVLVRGTNKELEIRYGKEDSGHGWVEIGDYVYDPSLLLRFKKEVYYKIYCPTNVKKYTKEEYCKSKVNQEFYDKIKNTSLNDFLPGGKERFGLCTIIPLIQSAAASSSDVEFKTDLDLYLKSIQYNYGQIVECLKDDVFESLCFNQR